MKDKEVKRKEDTETTLPICKDFYKITYETTPVHSNLPHTTSDKEVYDHSPNERYMQFERNGKKE